MNPFHGQTPAYPITSDHQSLTPHPTSTSPRCVSCPDAHPSPDLVRLLPQYPFALAQLDNLSSPLRRLLCRLAAGHRRQHDRGRILALCLAQQVGLYRGRRLFRRRLVARRHVAAGPLGSEPAVPANEEWLGVVCLQSQSAASACTHAAPHTHLDAPALVMHVVVAGIVPENLLQRVPRQRVAAVVVDRLHG